MSKSAAIIMVPLGGRPRLWLTVSRPERPHEYALPGGHIERGESAGRAAVRELREETAVTATSGVRLGVGRSPTGAPVHVFVATRWRGAALPTERDGRGGGEVAWLTWPQLRAQARRFGPFLDHVAASFRARFGVAP